MSHEKSRSFTPHSFSELQYVTTQPDDPNAATVLTTELGTWVRNVAIRNPLIERYATFKILQGLVTVGAQDLAVRSERYDVSGITYIDGVLCEPSQAAVMKGLASVSLGGMMAVTDEAFVAQHLAALQQRGPLDHVVIGRSGATLHAFNPGIDTIVQSGRR